MLDNIRRDNMLNHGEKLFRLEFFFEKVDENTF